MQIVYELIRSSEQWELEDYVRLCTEDESKKEEKCELNIKCKVGKND